jgi:ATP-binding cassette subfamily B protein
MVSANYSDHSINDTDQPPVVRVSWREMLQIVVPVFKQHRLRLTLGLIALLAVDLLQLIIPLFIQQGVDSLALSLPASSRLARLGGYIIGIASIVVVLRFAWRYLIIGFSRILETNLRNRMFQHIIHMDQSFFERWTSGDLMARASSDLSVVQMTCGMGLVAAVDAIVMSTTAICFMMFISFKLTLLALLPMPVLALCTRSLSNKLKQRYKFAQDKFSKITEFVRSTLLSMKLIKGYSLEQLQEKRFDHLGRSYVRSNLKIAVIQGILFPVANLVGNTSMLMVMYFGGILVMKKTITLGDFVAFLTYLFMMVWPIVATGWVASIAQRGATSLRRVSLLFKEKSKTDSFPAAADSSITPVSFQIRNLSFTYPSATLPALDGISLDIATGFTGITGRTGSGKSTFCNLLVRLYAVEDNCLFISNKDVNNVDMDTLRSNIAYVGQETMLFSASVAENIAFGRPDATFDDIRIAAKGASVHNDILRFPHQYDSIIGERGVKLSGGQKQRIALARALLSKRPVLIIDDALSAIDTDTVQQIISSIKTSMVNKTVILTSHSLKVLQATDIIFIFENGKIVTQGRHEDLLKNALFQTMLEKLQLDV